MSREAVINAAFLGKAPENHRDIQWILKLADRLAGRAGQASAPIPSNVIPFPGSGLRRKKRVR